MKEILDSPERLVLDDVPWLFSLFILGLTLVFAGIGLSQLLAGELGGLGFLFGGGGIGAIALIAFARRTRIDLDRAADSVTITSRSLIGIRARQAVLSEVTGAATERSSSNGRTPTYRPVLRLRAGAAVPILTAYSSGRGARVTADRINAWLGTDAAERDG